MKKNSNVVGIIVLPYLISLSFTATVVWGFNIYTQLVFHEYSRFYELYKWGTVAAILLGLIFLVLWILKIIRDKKENKLGNRPILKSLAVFLVATVINYGLMCLFMLLMR